MKTKPIDRIVSMNTNSLFHLQICYHRIAWTIHIPNFSNLVMIFYRLWPFYMILNTAIGGSWSGPSDNTTV